MKNKIQSSPIMAENRPRLIFHEFARFASPTGPDISLSKGEFYLDGPEISAREGLTIGITSGIHGDELNGTYICSLLIQFLKKLVLENTNVDLRAKIKILPAINPAGLNNSVRFLPFDETDINRMFPGYAQGETSQRLAAAVYNELSDITHLLDIHSSNVFVREVPQVRLYKWNDELLPLASAFGLPIIWLRDPTPVEKVQLVHTLSETGKKSFVIQAGNALEIDPKLCKNIALGILRWLSALGAIGSLAPLTQEEEKGIWFDGGGVIPPLIAKSSNIVHIAAESSGIFIGEEIQKQSFIGKNIFKGDCVGAILDPLTGNEREKVCSPVDGYLFTLRVHPIVYQGSLLARIVAKSDLPCEMVKHAHPQQPQ